MAKNIKEHAQAIVKECERVERIERSITELSKKHITQIYLRRYLSQGYDNNISVWVTEDDLPTEVLEVIKNFIISKLKESLSNTSKENL